MARRSKNMNIILLSDFISGYENIIHVFAEVIILTLELVAILTIVGGSIKSLYFKFSKLFKKNRHNIRMDLGRSLALGLEFAMGAEIIKTITIAHEWEEIAILGVIVGLRTILAVLIHWEVRMEEKENELKEKQAEKENIVEE